MGKRELVLIAAFVVLGMIVYQFTAPPPPPGSEAVGIGSIVRNIRRNIRGARDTATADSRQSIAVDSAATELRVNIAAMSDITVTGEDRADVAAQIHAVARGYEPGEAKASAEALKLKLERVGNTIDVSLDRAAAANRPARRLPPVQFTIALAVPRRLAVRIDPHFGRLVVTQVAGAEIAGARGETHVSAISGPLQLVHMGGPLEIDGAASLKLTARNSRGSIKRVTGMFTLDATGGDLSVSDVTGPVEVESRNTDLKISGLAALRPPLRVNATNGNLRVDGLRVEARIDGRNTEVDVAMDAAAAVTIYDTGENIHVTPPSGGYTLDALATDGRLTLSDGTLKPTPDPDPHAAGPIRGGGPVLTLRVTHGTISVAAPAVAGK